MERVLCVAAIVTCLVLSVACRREPPVEPTAPPQAEPSETAPTPAVRSFENLELRLSAEELPAPFALLASEGTTLVLQTDADAVMVFLEAHHGLGPDQLKTVARRYATRIERMNRGRVRGVEEGTGPLGPLVWVRSDYVEDDVPVAITVLVTAHPAGGGLLSLWYNHPLEEDDVRGRQLLDLLPYLKPA